MSFKNIYQVIFLVVLLGFQPNLFGQSKEASYVIRGTVSSKSTGETLIGVSVSEINSENRVVSGVVTDLNGQFVIKVKSLSNKLEFSYVGHKKIRINIGTAGVKNVALEDETLVLDQFEVTAKATQHDGALTIPKREISTAMQKFNTQELEGLQVNSIDEALQGRIAGMDIVSNSGDPGSGSTIRIRGASTINANSNPLLVVNNVPWETEIDSKFDFANANKEQWANMLSIGVDDINEITVLKDAASTAIWGSKGGNGVILITTKKGYKGPTNVTYSYKFSRAVQPNGLNLLNGDDYTMMIKQAKFNPFQYENASNAPEYNYITTYSEYENFNNNTDWVDEVTQVGLIHDHYLSITGGGDRAKYRVSAGYLNQVGTVIGQKNERYTTRAYLDYNVSDRLRINTEFSFTFSDNKRNYDNLLGIAYRKMPNVSVYKQTLSGNNTDVYYNIPTEANIDDGQKYLYNPVALAYLASNNLKNFRIVPIFRIAYDILNPEKQKLQYNMYLSFDMDNNKIATYLPQEATNKSLSDGGKVVGRSERADNENFTLQMDNNITWAPRFSSDAHSFQLYGSFQLRSGRSAPLGITSFGFPSSEITDATSQGILLSMGSRSSRWRSMAMLARAHYAFKQKYILDLTIRRDGSTKFGDDNKFGNFPGISAKWIISDEPFMKSTQKWLSMLAVRPSWGISGRQPDAEYLHYSRYTTYGVYLDMPAVLPSSLPLVNLRWEKTTQTNVGMDIGFFNDKLVFDLNYYYSQIDDMLQKNLEIPGTSGYNVIPWANVGEMENKGWEVFITGNKVITAGKDFSVDFNFNLANNKNTLISLDPRILANYNLDYNYENGVYLSRLQENNAYGSIYGFRYKGVYQYNDYIPGVQENAPVARDANGNVIYDNFGVPLPMKFAYGRPQDYTFRGGDAIYEDINHDGNIDELDIVYLGNSNPDLNGGFGTSLRYKNFGVTAYFVFRTGNKIVNTARMDLENMFYDNNQSIAVNYRWRKDGDVTEMPRALYQYGRNWLGSDRFVEDGSFLRFKYLTFRYSVTKKVLEKFRMKSFSTYLTINNLATFTKYTGVDPEVGYGSFGVSKDGNKTPRSKDFTLGITIGF